MKLLLFGISLLLFSIIILLLQYEWIGIITALTGMVFAYIGTFHSGDNSQQ